MYLNLQFLQRATNIDRVVITPLTSTGTATGTQTGSEANRMLSLYEIEFETDSAVKATGIEFTENSANSVYTGAIAEVSAVVTPDNATNPFYEITSSDENIAKVIKIQWKINIFMQFKVLKKEQ